MKNKYDKFGIGIDLEDIQKQKWGQLEKCLNRLIKKAGLNGRFEFQTQPHVVDKKAVVAICLEVEK